jgi:NADH:ubiquinone oxidoreductase subunit 5 (subunit L)/multisubunit Na+/H+ antiporter MnhA subunit
MRWKAHARVRADPRRDDGGRRRLHAVPHAFLFNADALHVIAYIGGFTALLAALIAVQQNDIKRILAYSTLSQLGYMVMAVGLDGPTPAMFHLTTHAFFKALLFLGAGSVIHGLHHEQDIWKMGNCERKCPSRSGRSSSARWP